MPRIRSVHPGFFTDDAFCELCEAAQIFYIGILTECDDQGMFEWKPGQLKRRLRSGKDGDVTPLLEELVRLNCIRRVEIAGREYGAVRNFRKYQRPKKPNAVHPINDELRTYVALSVASSEPEDDEAGEQAELGLQREEGGGRRKGKSSLRSDYPEAFEAIWSSLPKRSGSNDKKLAFGAWKARQDEGHTVEEMQAGAERYARWCRATGKENTEKVLQGATFLGPADPPHFANDWPVPGQVAAVSAAPLPCHDSLLPWRERIIGAFGVPCWNSWFANCEVSRVGDDFTLFAPTRPRADYIRNNYSGPIDLVFGGRVLICQAKAKDAAA